MLYFYNETVLPKEAFTSFGISAKPNSDSPIGYFGTGLKYALAILLRTGHEVYAQSDGETYTFGTEDDYFRGERFTYVTMNGRKLSFTTELGKDWELWQAYRELYCNALDEGGGVATRSQDVMAQIVVRGAGIEQVHRDRHEYFLHGNTAKVISADEGTTLEVLDSRSRYGFLRGVRVYDLPCDSMYCYNMRSGATLSEDRTLKYFWELSDPIEKFWAIHCTDREAVRAAVTAPKGTYEEKLAYGSVPTTAVSDLFASVVAEEFSLANQRLNKYTVELCRGRLLKTLPNVTAMSPLEEKRLAKAVAFLKSAGHDVTAYPILISDHLGEGVMGRAHDDTIYVSRLAFDKGTKSVVSVLFEEYVHLKYGHRDCTYAMQNWLFDQLIGAWEVAAGEPL